MSARLPLIAVLLAGMAACDARPQQQLQRYRKAAPMEDSGPQIKEPVFGPCAGLKNTDRTFRVMEWIAKRSWHVLGLPYQRKDYSGPPAMKLLRITPSRT